MISTIKAKWYSHHTKTPKLGTSMSCSRRHIIVPKLREIVFHILFFSLTPDIASMIWSIKFTMLLSLLLSAAFVNAQGGGTLIRFPCSQIVIDRIDP